MLVLATQRWLTGRQVAWLLDVHTNTVRNRANAGELPYWRMRGGEGFRRYRADEIEIYRVSQLPHGPVCAYQHLFGGDWCRHPSCVVISRTSHLRLRRIEFL